MKPPTEKPNGGSVSRATATVNPAKDNDTLRDLSKWLKSQWLRSYTLHMALGGEADRVAMVMLAACVKMVKEAQSWQR